MRAASGIAIGAISDASKVSKKTKLHKAIAESTETEPKKSDWATKEDNWT